MEVWKKWLPIQGISSSFFIESIICNTKGLFIRLKMNGQNRYILAKDDSSIISYRVTQQKVFMKILKNIKFDTNWSLFQVNDSEYVNWLREENYQIYEYYKEFNHELYNINHYIFLGKNIIFELVTHSEPHFVLQVE